MRPFVSYDDLVPHICLADVSINTFIPSLVTHCVLPGRVLQSMACGIPVVSTPLQGMMNYSHGTDTVVYRNLDPSFVEAVVNLLADTTKSQVLGEAGRNLVAAKGSWQDFVDNFANLAQKVSVTK
jgi:glycosyltransferase involved in cell wall biosynthesis